ncbi:MAG: 23S rRNA (adenine(2503)-C(2))-methyltransferase RlmN [Candidatus Omnitrophica bacterium]|nr:23S rRNA (adenine(2503)-C(2))-methyltransferase RlmN [Candidatus Omnitrophota bacterium]
MVADAALPRLIDQTRDSIRAWLASLGEEAYRAEQIHRGILRLTPISQMSDLPRGLRVSLAEAFTEGYPVPARWIEGEGEGADRFLFTLPDGEAVESVRIGPLEDYTACLSTQVGCGLRCAFCASGKFGLTRNLSVGEIVGQVLALRAQTATATGLEGWPSRLVYMGMGEPFQNYSAVLESIKRLTDPTGPGLGARRITLSTAGMVPEIYRFAEEGLQVGLAVSLHAPNSELRRSLMPIEEIYPLKTLLRACQTYIEKSGRRLTFEYILLKGVNDSPAEAKGLVDLFRNWSLVHINLIRYNPIGLTRLEAPKESDARAFVKRLVDGGLDATLRKSPGRNIDAACGQLRGLEYEKAGVRIQPAAMAP